MNKFVNKFDNSLTNSLSVKEIEFVAKNIHQKKTPGLCGLTGETYQKFKEEITSIYTKSFNKFKRKVTL